MLGPSKLPNFYPYVLIDICFTFTPLRMRIGWSITSCPSFVEMGNAAFDPTLAKNILIGMCFDLTCFVLFLFLYLLTCLIYFRAFFVRRYVLVFYPHGLRDNFYWPCAPHVLLFLWYSIYLLRSTHQILWWLPQSLKFHQWNQWDYFWCIDLFIIRPKLHSLFCL